jgi:general secretion pathway protein L
MLAHIFNAWVDGLAAALVWVEELFHRARRFQIRANSQPLTLISLDSPASERYPIDPEQLDKLPPNILEQTRGSIIEIVVPAVAILERRLEPLPAESLPYLGNVVSHQIDVLFPWRSTDILYSTLTKPQGDGRLDVSVRATPRSAIAPLLAVADACGAAEIIVVSDGEFAPGQRPAGILASIGPEKAKRYNRARLIARYAAIAVTALAVFVAGWTTFAGWSLAGDVAALDQAVAERRAILERSKNSAEATQNKGLEAKKRTSPTAVVLLEELSTILPDGTYLTDLSIEAGHLRMSGVSANAADLIPILEQSGHFKNASFYAPTTRSSSNSTDRFSIEANVISHTQGDQ